MKIPRLNFYGFGRLSIESEPAGQYCRISDLPKEIQEALFDPIPKREGPDDDDNDDQE